jgi:hypothetical protein
MRPSRCIPIVLAALVMALAAPEPAQARRNKQAFSTAPVAPAVQPLVSLTLEQPGGVPLPSFLHLGSLYFGGQQGERYDLRLTNNTGERVEAVITVDGRDVISGELGNFKKQRGYVLEPWGSVVISGYRQSLQQVAAFRFADLSGSYTALRGSPEHAGVVGVAVFTEKRRSAKRHKKALAAAPPPPNYYEPYYQGPVASSAPPTAFPESERRAEKAAGDAAAEESVAMAPSAAPVSADAGGAGGFAPPPAQSQLGTAYGETQYSAVQEVEFKRHRKRKPDAILTVYYDSLSGLQSRGITVSAPPLGNPLAVEPQPFPQSQSGFATPPPR